MTIGASIANRYFEQARRRPAPQSLLQTIHDQLGWHLAQSTKTTFGKSNDSSGGNIISAKRSGQIEVVQKRNSLAYPYRNTMTTKHTHLLSLIKQVKTGTVPPKLPITERAAPFAIPKVTFLNGMDGFVRPLQALIFRFSNKQKDSAGLYEFVKEHILCINNNSQFKRQGLIMSFKGNKIPITLLHVNNNSSLLSGVLVGLYNYGGKYRRPAVIGMYASGAQYPYPVHNMTARQIFEKIIPSLRDRSGEKWLERRTFTQRSFCARPKDTVLAVRPIQSAFTYPLEKQKEGLGKEDLQNNNSKPSHKKEENPEVKNELNKPGLDANARQPVFTSAFVGRDAIKWKGAGAVHHPLTPILSKVPLKGPQMKADRIRKAFEKIKRGIQKGAEGNVPLWGFSNKTKLITLNNIPTTTQSVSNQPASRTPLAS